MLKRRTCDKCGDVMMTMYRPSSFWSERWIWAWYCQSCKATIPISTEAVERFFGRDDAIQSDVD